MIRRLFALLVAALLLVEGAGVARALGGDTILCCCGRHESHRVCKCKSCPVLAKRARVGTSRFAHARDCDGHDEAPALSVLAIESVAPTVQRSEIARAHENPAAQPLVSRVVDAGRPPP